MRPFCIYVHPLWTCLYMGIHTSTRTSCYSGNLFYAIVCYSPATLFEWLSTSVSAGLHRRTVHFSVQPLGASTSYAPRSQRGRQRWMNIYLSSNILQMRRRSSCLLLLKVLQNILVVKWVIFSHLRIFLKLIFRSIKAREKVIYIR